MLWIFVTSGQLAAGHRTFVVRGLLSNDNSTSFLLSFSTETTEWHGYNINRLGLDDLLSCGNRLTSGHHKQTMTFTQEKQIFYCSNFTKRSNRFRDCELVTVE